MRARRRDRYAAVPGCDLQRDTDGVIRLSGTLDFESAPRLYARTASIFAEGDDVVIDGSALDSANSAGLALLLEWLAEARRRECTMSFRVLPEALLALARLSGVDDLLTDERPGRRQPAAL
jgi:phospholipid transport system transporter-binding protein